jgi:NAD(P)-dependent dehydrogenase (short-subunit alcohol dehydrogenase family)
MAFDQELLGLTGKKALVLGAGQGIGEGIALLFARAGVSVALVDREIARADAVATRVRASGVAACSLRADVTDDGELVSAINSADAVLDGVDILVTVVGMATFKSALELTMEDWDLDQRRNLRYVFLAARSFVECARARGNGGVITCISSMSGVRSAAGHAAYGAAKDGLVNLVRTLAVEWAPHRIRINAVTPGSIATPNFPDSPESREILRTSLVPMGRSGTIDEITRPLLFLSSDLATYIPGHNLWVDGGWGAANLFRAT